MFKIISNFSEHGFRIGDTVLIVQDDADGMPLVSNGSHTEFVIMRDLDVVK